MHDGPSIVGIGALLGDPTRADVLTALMSDRALTPSELAAITGVTKQTISAHLARLHDAGLVKIERQGRYRYVRLAGADVAQLLEVVMQVASRTGVMPLRAGPRDPALRRARICYDHLAGEVAVHVYDQLIRSGSLEEVDTQPHLTDLGVQRFAALGIDIEVLRARRRTVCRACLDWSERRHHLAGALGSALLDRILAAGWARRARDSRVITFTPPGRAALRAWVG